MAKRMMLMDNNLTQKQAGKEVVFIKPEILLRYLITDDETVDTLITCKNTEYDIVTSDNTIYQALGSIQQYDNVKLNRLTKFFEVVEVFSAKEKTGKEKRLLTHERVEELRKLALSGVSNSDKISPDKLKSETQAKTRNKNQDQDLA